MAFEQLMYDAATKKSKDEKKKRKEEKKTKQPGSPRMDEPSTS
jgi:hypothetical protein